MTAAATAEHDWALFEDWCAAMEHVPLPASVETLNAFLTAVPGRPSTTRRRLRAVRAKHLAARLQLPIALPAQSTTVRTGVGWVSIERALAQLPTLRYPVGLRGRRDGWLLVLIGVLGLSRQEALDVTANYVQLFPEIRIADRPVPRTALATECPACAVTRWLRVVGPAAAGHKSTVQEMLDPRGVDDQAHDCALGLDGSWRDVSVLAVAVDQAGWVAAGRPLSGTSVSAIMKARQWLAGDPVRSSALKKSLEGRFQDSSAAELYAAMGETYDQVDAEFARSQAALDQALATLSELDDIWNPAD